MNIFNFIPLLRWMRGVFVASVSLCVLAAMGTAFSCTTFVLADGEEVYFGRNLDWSCQKGMVIVNQRRVRKTSLVPPGMTAAKWVSKYGSVTFNQFGQEMPYGGMNEAGLVVECMWLNETQYPADDSRAAINLLQWMQYQLDTCRTVDEVLATDTVLRLYAPPGGAKIHYLIADARGNSAAIEILDGKMVSRRGKDLPIRILANDVYSVSLANTPFDLSNSNAVPGSSQWRFCTAASRAARFRAGSTEANLKYAFDVLNEVRQGNLTVWSVVYNMPGRTVHFRTRNNFQVHAIDFKSLDFSCKAPVRYVDIQSNPQSTGNFEWLELSEVPHRRYLQELVSDPSLRKRFGDLTPQIMGQLSMLRGFDCLDASDP